MSNIVLNNTYILFDVLLNNVCCMYKSCVKCGSD